MSTTNKNMIGKYSLHNSTRIPFQSASILNDHEALTVPQDITLQPFIQCNTNLGCKNTLLCIQAFGRRGPVLDLERQIFSPNDCQNVRRWVHTTNSCFESSLQTSKTVDARVYFDMTAWATKNISHENKTAAQERCHKRIRVSIPTSATASSVPRPPMSSISSCTPQDKHVKTLVTEILHYSRRKKLFRKFSDP